MCKPTIKKGSPKTKPAKKPALSKATTISAAIFAFFLCVAPALISEQIGGWTRKYTSPRPIFIASSIQDMTGQVAVVTGANTGIGYYTALELARSGATVIVAARNPNRGEAAVERIKREIPVSPSSEVHERVKFIPLDLSSLSSVKNFASDFKKLQIPLHALVLNAGIMKSPGSQFVGKNLTYGFSTSNEGFESHIGVNHIGHFYLTKLLISELKKSSPSRVVSVSSLAEMGAYENDGIRFETWKPSKSDTVPSDYEDGIAYGQSKLANIFFTKELAARLNGTGVTAYSCHPGVIVTELGRDLEKVMLTEMAEKGFLATFAGTLLGGFFQLSNFKAEDGALTQLHLATADPSKLVNGAFYHPIGRLVGNAMHPQGGKS